MQQVNLYLPELRPPKEWLTASTIALSGIGFLCLLLVGSMFLKSGVENLQAQLAMLESQVSSSADRITSIGKSAKPLDAARLDREIRSLNKAIAAREQIGQIIQGQNLGNEDGFSTAMLALARESFSSISLQHIKISRGGSFIETKGLTSNAQDVPRYIQNLRKHHSLSNTQFGLLSISEDVTSPHFHSFAIGFDSLSNLAQAAPARANANSGARVRTVTSFNEGRR